MTGIENNNGLANTRPVLAPRVQQEDEPFLPACSYSIY
jgi:hypothetical protein